MEVVFGVERQSVEEEEGGRVGVECGKDTSGVWEGTCCREG